MEHRRITQMIPSAETFLALSPEELAGYVLEHIQTMPPRELSQLNRHNFTMGNTVSEYPNESLDKCAEALAEAWSFLEVAGFLSRRPAQSSEAYFLTRKGLRTRGREAFLTALQASRFPADVHPTIHEKCFSLVVRGDYETAVFQAFKSVEVAVRTAAKQPKTSYGVPLMRSAFHPEKGALTDTSEPSAEREALQSLFAGAIGRFKNPTSHRHVSFDSAAEPA